MTSPTLPSTARGLYTPLYELSSGYRGTVFICRPSTPEHSPQQHPLVALKVLKPTPLKPTAAQSRTATLTALKAAQQQQRSNIPQLLDLSHASAARSAWYTMSLIQGCTLAQFAAAYAQPLPFPLVFHVFAELLAAVRFLHAAGRVHDDLGAGNVMLEWPGGGGEWPGVVLVDVDDLRETSARRPNG
ncbi:hypothetical protein BU26DRAFT_570483, partial [Trematosphaeria pertusa]